MRRSLWLAAAVAASACATAPRPDPARAPAEVATADDEVTVSRDAAVRDDAYERAGHFVRDPSVEAYLLGVARRLYPVEEVRELRVRVMREPFPNAFARPNGTVVITTGMAAVVENEAELAALLGHEISHFVRRHTAASLHRARESQGILAALDSPGPGGAARAEHQLLSSLEYSRGQERDADRDGITRAVRAGYDGAAATRLLEREDAREARDGRSVPWVYAQYSTHPRTPERIASSRELVNALGGGGAADGTPRYDDRMAPVLLEHAAIEAARGRFEAARAAAARVVAVHPRDPAAHVALGDLARREATKASDAAAEASYRRALDLDARSADAWRGLGLVARRRGDAAGARAAFERCVALAPDAPDAPFVVAALRDLEGGPP